jgi:hypothetical protein
MLITTEVANSNPIHGKVYSMQHYVIKFVITVTFVLSQCVLLYILIRYSGHLFNVVSGHHLLVIFSIKPLYNGNCFFNNTGSDFGRSEHESDRYDQVIHYTKVTVMASLTVLDCLLSSVFFLRREGQ